MRRLLVWSFAVLFGLLVTLMGTVVWLATSDSGSARLLRVAEYFLDGALQVGSVSGRIGDRFCAADARYVTESVRVSAHDLCVGVDLSRLVLEDELRFNVVSAQQVTVVTVPDETEADTGFFPLELVLPIAVILPELTVDELVVDESKVTAISFAGSATGRAMKVDAAAAMFLEYRFRLQGDFAWRGWGEADLGFNVAGDDLDVDGALQGSLRDMAWTLIGRQPVVATASGRVNLLDDALPFDLEVAGQGIDVSRWIDRALRVNGILAANGDLAGYRFDFRGRLEDAELGGLDLLTSGIGDWGSVQGDVTASRDTGMASGKARVRWSPELSFQASLALHDVEVVSDATRLQFSGDLGVSGTSARIEGELAGMNGIVNEVGFSGGGRFDWSPESLTVSGLALRVGEGGLNGSVTMTGDVLAAELLADDLGLSHLDARAGGDLNGRVRATGQWPDLSLQGQLTVVQPSFEDYSARSLSILMDAASEQPLQVQAEQLMVAERLVGDVRVDLRGALEAGSVDVGVIREGARLESHADYRWADSQLTGELTIAAIEYPGLGAWQGSRAAGFSYLDGAVALELLCLNNLPGAELCVAVGYPEGETVLRLRGVELRQLALLDGELKASVNISADARFAKLTPGLEGVVEFQLGDLEVLLDPDVDAYRLGNIQGNADVSDSGARGRLATDAGAGITLDLDFATDGLQAHAPISGTGRVGLQDLALLDPFLPDEIGELAGSFAGEFDLLGHLDAPLWSGKLSWSAGQMRVVPVGALLTDVTASVAAADGLRADMRLSAGEGSIVVAANAEEVGLGAGQRFQGSVTLDRARIVDLPDYQVLLSGEVTARRRDGVLEVDGSLNVPEATIAVKQLPEEALSSSPDVVVVEEEPPEVLGRKMDLKVGFGDAVRVSAYGLDTGVSGQLQLKESPGRLLQVNGVLDLHDGTFAAYGQELVIQRGRLIFNGPLDNPTLDVLARRSVESGGDKYDVLLTLTGPAKRIVTGVSSQPATTEADALSLLVTGRRLHDSSRTERVNLAAAAKVLGMKSASLLSDRIGGMLGVDEVIVEGDDENLEVGAAMQVNPNLYLRYTYDVFSRLGGVLLSYQLTKNLSLHGKSGDAQSIHLNYEIER